MKKLVLTTLNARYTHTCLALYYLQSVLKGSRVEVEVCEFNINQSKLDIIEALLSRKADYLAFSIYIWNAEPVRAILEEVKKLSEDTIIILGGPEVSYQTGKWEADYIVSGNSEGVIREILNDEAGKLKGIIAGRETSIDELPFPYKEFSFEGKDSRYFYYETSRGCPFRCAYCLSSRSDQRLQYRSLEKVFSELEYFIQSGYRHIKLVDRTFNANPERSRAIWSHLVELYAKYPGSETGFHFEIHPQLLGEEDFVVLEKVPPDRFRFEIGIQTLNEEVGQIIHRQMDWGKIEENIGKIRQMGNIYLHLDLIAGLPGENLASLASGFDKVIKLRSDHLQLGFLKILAGTEMEGMVDKYGIIYESKPPYQVLQTHEMNWQELGLVRRIEAIFEIYYNSQKFMISVGILLESGISMWSIFKGLAEYYDKQGLDLRMRDWEKCAQAFWQYVTENGIIEKEELLDHLRLDWCKLARSHYYPEFLRHTLLDEARENGYKRLLERKKEEILLKPAEMRQAIFFQPVSGYYEKKEIWVFYGRPGKKQVLKL